MYWTFILGVPSRNSASESSQAQIWARNTRRAQRRGRIVADFWSMDRAMRVSGVYNLTFPGADEPQGAGNRAYVVRCLVRGPPTQRTDGVALTLIT